MGIYKLVLPKMGESVSEATLTNWLKSLGDAIQEDEAVVEIATDKVDSDVPSPVAGKLKEILFTEGEIAQVGDVIAILEVEGESDAEEAEKQREVPQDNFGVPVPGLDALENKALPTQDTLQATITSENRFYSPLVKSIAQEEGIAQDELDKILGSGSDGRVTKQDVLDYIAAKGDSSSIQSSASIGSVAPVSDSRISNPNVSTAVQVLKSMDGDEIIEMDRMRRLISDHMVNSVKTSPHVFSVVEADVTNLVNWRNKVKDAFKKREGENITFTPLIIEAISKALKDFPMVNVSVDGYNIIKRKHINVGMAAALPTGNLIVPVIKDADQLSLVGLSKSVNDLANRARTNQLKPDDTQGGTFTFTNIGAFGNIFGMPIINQPQAAILAVGTIKKKPAVLETEHGDVIAIRHMMYITMSYDHRVIDGALGGTFIKRVADYLESWDSDRTI
ncbi:dihydrolipoamide acetyltransferase family protein [Sphingobacterium pedocola]|uniref:Dihydrolipoamide acetyltransferase component of pyruvate dehydrogenase complex n=1 Tax=Sphingobacterium pedocola TaxID=2082722 RepID=A0ABR9TDU2_9SPHI|nr:dihydrolipoamide acetyltransferase family protein [Sphingobacterium pedocola]MBE8723229.1 diapophytoene dehydrogenase [Sphingobacterium pedocola]